MTDIAAPSSQQRAASEPASTTVHQTSRQVNQGSKTVSTDQAVSRRVFSNTRILSLLNQTKWQLILIIFTSALFATTAWFAQSTFSVTSMISMNSRLSGMLHTNVSSTLTILRLLEGLLSLCASSVLSAALENLQWTLSSTKKGLRVLTFLGLSPTSGFWGALTLSFSRNARFPDRLASAVRISLLTSIWISGIVLFAKTRLHIVYEPVRSYNVTAGVGKFNGSYVSEYLQQLQDTNDGYNYTVLPYTNVIASSNLVVNPMQSTTIEPVACGEERVCQGYLISGGLMMTTPWPPKDHLSSPFVTIQNAPALQIDFTRGIHNDTFDDAKDCNTFGGNGYLIGIKFCLAKSQSTSGALFAGIFICTSGKNGNECWTSTHPPEVTTTFSVYHRHASITTARTNLSIMSLDKLDEPIQDTSFDVESLKAAYAWLFNFTAAGIPAPASISQYFWSVQDQLESDFVSIEPYQIFQSVLAYPFWWFNPNNFGNVDLDAQNITAGLPSDFYTTASIASPYNKIMVDRSMFILFCVLQTFVIGFGWVVLMWHWIMASDLLVISSYPIIDFSMKTDFTGIRPTVAQIQDSDKSGVALTTALDDRTIRRILKDERVKCITSSES